MNEAVQYEERDFINPFAHDTIYRGPPTPELESAWVDLWFCKWHAHQHLRVRGPRIC